MDKSNSFTKECSTLVFWFYAEQKFPKPPIILHANVKRTQRDGKERDRLYLNLSPSSANRLYRTILRKGFFLTNFKATKDKPACSIHRFRTWRRIYYPPR